MRTFAWLLLAGAACLSAVSSQTSLAQNAPAPAAPSPAPDPSTPQAGTPTPAAAPPVEQPCGARAARFEGAKGFKMVVTRAGQVRTTNPLRPLTPEVSEVLLVVVGGKVATAYGPDFSTLRRGSAPAAIEAMLGGPIRWQAALPTLPDPIAIVSEEGSPLAELSFRACEDPPAVKAAQKPVARKKSPARHAAPKAAAEKTPPGFSMPQGAIAE
ncbi:hypothetical protein GOFOIKOB_1078 [Methylobacterium tardum]|uniref:Uncharacterized protein n=1 Tax=Methylobacterium tardum TaxID=374432 RepID=A0AA37TJN7_9HYPH|nr:hypothetical protein [Methylobacterium tardum]GJE48053.1 hypothetical protein GOFOIKOB_1078 [Methylobacterium tardum]GLS69303.1 hypothetical protein GCM10007890_13160 [Methylobacterium tardum]